MMSDKEMEQLKQEWQQQVAIENPRRVNVGDIRSHARQAALTALKKSYRRQILLLAAVLFMIMHQFRNRDFLHSIFFWAFVVFCLALIIYSYANTRMVNRLQSADQPLSKHLQQQVSLLRKRMQLHLVFTRGAAVVFFMMAEALPFFSDESMLVKWHGIPPFLRILVYVSFLTLQYFVGRRLARQRYGQHLDRLQTLLTDTQ